VISPRPAFFNRARLERAHADDLGIRPVRCASTSDELAEPADPRPSAACDA
jgi:hypothetical protein